MLKKGLINSLGRRIVACIATATMVVSSATICMAREGGPELYVMYNTNYGDPNKPDEGWTLQEWQDEIKETARYVSNEMEYINNQLNSNGYFSPYVYDDNRAVTVTECMKNAAIFIFRGHGAPGVMCCYAVKKEDESKKEEQFIGASKNVEYSVQSYIPSNMRKCKVAYFSTCYSASYPEGLGYYDSIVGACDKGGADAVIGYKNTVYTKAGAYMASRIFTCHQFRRLGDAVSYSIVDINNDFGRGSLFATNIQDNIFIAGNTGVKITPASYGSY